MSINPNFQLIRFDFEFNRLTITFNGTIKTTTDAVPIYS